jgi:hypothetical protein
LKNNPAGVREREDANRTREAGNRGEVEGVVANTLNVFRNGAVGFIDWLGEKPGFKECNVKRTDAHDDIKHAVKARQKVPEASQTNPEGDKDNTEKRE